MRTTIRALLAAPLLLLLAGCTPILALPAADDAASPACADVIVGLRNLDTLEDLPARETDAQGTAAWGNPASIILRCGVAPPPPTARFRCLTVGAVDWLIDDSKDPNVTATTYGREPAVEVLLKGQEVTSATVLTDLANAVSLLPTNGHVCQSLEDVTPQPGQ